jgi:hypothetical protein
MRKFFRSIFSNVDQDDLPAAMTSPDPDEILRSAQGQKKYVGTWVQWELTVESMNNYFGPNEVVVVTSYRNSPANIWVAAPAADNQAVYDHGSGDRLVVRGRVKAIRGKDIYLEECQLRF